MDKAVNLLDSLPKFKNEKHQQLAVQLAGAAVLSTVLYSSYKLIAGTNKKPKGLKEIPVPKSSYPYVGHMFSLGELPGKTISKWHKELGPILKLHMGAQTWIMIDDPTLAQKIFVSNGAETSYRPECEFNYRYHSMNGKGISFAQPGPDFKENRSAALTVLAPKLITDNYMDSIKKEAHDLVSRFIESSNESEGGIYPLKYLELNSMNVITSACFGKKYDNINDPEFINLSEVVEITMELGGIDNDLPNFLPIIKIFDYFAGTKEKMEKFIKTRRDPTFKKHIQEAFACEGPNVMKSLEENGFHFTEDQKLVLAADLIVAGTDTISVTLLWNFAIMCNYPEVQKKVSNEIDEFVKLNGRLPEFTDRMEVPYCISVMKETMRFKPITPFGLPHAVRKDVEVDGYIIPKGASIVANMLSMHKQPELYPEPHSFKPERFMSNLKTMQSAANGRYEERDHFNFGFGRRVCPGIYLAEVELFSAFIQVFSRTFIEPVGEMPDIESTKNAGLTLSLLPYKVKFVKRQTDYSF